MSDGLDPENRRLIEAAIQKMVQTNISAALQQSVTMLWLERGGLQMLDPEDAMEFSFLIGQMERLAARIAAKARKRPLS